MQVVIDNRSGQSLPIDEVERLALFTLENRSAPENLELSLSFVTEDEIRQLNRDFRGKDAPTDVLSFECDDIADAKTSDQTSAILLLGDIIIAPSVAEQHAQDFDSTFEQELYLIVIHGILHLLGFDHLVDDEADEMEALEDQLLDLWAQHQVKQVD